MTPQQQEALLAFRQQQWKLIQTQFVLQLSVDFFRPDPLLEYIRKQNGAPPSPQPIPAEQTPRWAEIKIALKQLHIKMVPLLREELKDQIRHRLQTFYPTLNPQRIPT